jgi:hypothetical protein
VEFLHPALLQFTGAEAMPRIIYVTTRGAINARLAHHPANFTQRVVQPIYAAPAGKRRGRFTNVVISGTEGEPWYCTVLLLFYLPARGPGKPRKPCALIRFFEQPVGDETPIAGCPRVRRPPLKRAGSVDEVALEDRYRVVKLSDLVRVVDLVPDVLRTGLRGTSRVWFVNTFTWSQEPRWQEPFVAVAAAPPAAGV